VKTWFSGCDFFLNFTLFFSLKGCLGYGLIVSDFIILPVQHVDRCWEHFSNHEASASLELYHNLLKDGFEFWLDLWIVVHYDLHPMDPRS